MLWWNLERPSQAVTRGSHPLVVHVPCVSPQVLSYSGSGLGIQHGRCAITGRAVLVGVNRQQRACRSAWSRASQDHGSGRASGPGRSMISETARSNNYGDPETRFSGVHHGPRLAGEHPRRVYDCLGKRHVHSDSLTAASVCHFLCPLILRGLQLDSLIVSHSETLIKSRTGCLYENLRRVDHTGSAAMTHWSRILPWVSERAGAGWPSLEVRRFGGGALLLSSVVFVSRQARPLSRSRTFSAGLKQRSAGMSWHAAGLSQATWRGCLMFTVSVTSTGNSC